LPSVPAWTIPASAFASSTPYYGWQHLVVVPDGSAMTTLAGVHGGIVCAVRGDAGEAWLRGTYGGAPAPATGATVVTAASDDACLAMVASGDAVAAVTADLTTGDVAARGGFRTIDGPAPEPRVIVAPATGTGSPDPSALIADVDAALEGMRADGTLARLSENRFGLDLTKP
jgi:ABC-type amino acid transport substrate-binding protein